MTKADLARRLGISRQVLYRDLARGCPDDLEGAREWRRRNVAPRHDGRDDAGLRRYLGEGLYPRLITDKTLRGVITGYARGELNATKAQAVQLFRMLAYGLMCAIEEAHEVEGIYFAQPPEIDEIVALGNEGYVAKHWPDNAPQTTEKE